MFDSFLSQGGSAPIYEQINEYAYWKSKTHPMVAGAHRALLWRMADRLKITSIEDITVDHIAFFTGEQLTGFYIEKAFQALRGFLQYASMAGYQCISHKLVNIEHMTKIGRPVQWDMVKEVREMKEYGLSNETIAKLLTQKLDKRVHKKSVDRWNKRIPELKRVGE